VISIHDTLRGEFTAQVDDVVLRRNDGTPAYNLAVVVDDALQGVTQICRGDDLLSSTPRQVYLQRLLGYPPPEYLHVPLVLGNDGERLSKRNGALSLRDLNEQGQSAESVRETLLASVGGRFSTDALLRVGTWTI
jgi:glutamyl-tRNA synthetase